MPKPNGNMPAPVGRPDAAHHAHVGLWSYLKTLFWPTVASMAGFPGVVLAVATLFLPAPTNAKYGLLCLAATSLLAATYLSWSAERARANRLAATVATQGRLAIEFRPGEEPFETERRSLYGSAHRHFGINVRNVGGSSVSRCRVWLVSCEPLDGRRAGEVLIASPERELHPGEAYLMPMVSFREWGENKGGDTFGTLHGDLAEEALGVGCIIIGREHRYTAGIRATGDGSEPCPASFEVWITPGNELRMIRLP
jgi:hypothetical protein